MKSRGLEPFSPSDDDLEFREDFRAFCGHGRLVGTLGNQKAIDSLSTWLDQQGFQVHVEKDKRRAWSALAVCLIFIPFILFLWPVVDSQTRVSTTAVALLVMGPMFRAAYYIFKKTPLALFGVRPQGEKPMPTILLTAHFDTASIPLGGSFMSSNLFMFLAVIAISILSRLLPPIAAILAAGILGIYVLGNASRGGDDNASGVFTVLSCVKKMKDLQGLNIVPIFFNFEEEGLFGSSAWHTNHRIGKGRGIPSINVDPSQAYVINFDCVGRGKRLFISGKRAVVEALLQTPCAQRAGLVKTSWYPSDHISFKKPWQTAAFLRADRYWLFDLSWLHSKNDVPEKVNLDYLHELSSIVQEFAERVSLKAGGRSTQDCKE